MTTENTTTIIKGRFPLFLVWTARFHYQDFGLSKMAKMLCTTPGKIQDIRKVSSFKYINERFEPSQDMVDDALEWLNQCIDLVEDSELLAALGDIKTKVEETDIMSVEALTEFEEQKRSTRKPRGKKSEVNETPETDEIENSKELNAGFFDS